MNFSYDALSSFLRWMCESRELDMSCDDLCTTLTNLPTSYQDLITSDWSFQRFTRDQGAGNASFWPGAAKRLPKLEGEGAPRKNGTFKGKSQSEIYNVLHIGIYPYTVITLSGMMSIFVSLYTQYKILFKHHTLQLSVMVLKFICDRANGARNLKKKICKVAIWKITSYEEQKNPILVGLYADFCYIGRLKRPLISNISLPFLNVSDQSERALGEGAVSRLKLGARLIMRGKGYTYQPKKELISKYKE